MIQINDKAQCCGCTACRCVCPVGAIQMAMDREGFFYPTVDTVQCIRCGRCITVCPYQSSAKLIASICSSHLAIQTKEEQKRVESTAGGAFSLIAEEVLKRHGLVYGAGYKEMEVCHKAAYTEEELRELVGSKYVQSKLENTFFEIRRHLQEGRLILFVGTPCQVYGLKRYLGDHQNLITMDLICLGVSSPAIFHQWISYLSDKYHKPVRFIQFRNKEFGYSVSNVRVWFDDGCILEQTYDSKSYTKTIFEGYNVRPSCYRCKFRCMPRISDFTIGDCIQIGTYSRDMDDDKGTTSLWIHTEKARQIFKSIQENAQWIEIEKSCSNIIESGKIALKIPAERSDFFFDAISLPYRDFIHKWVPDTIKSRSASIFRIIVHRLPFGTYVFKKIRRSQSRRFKKRILNR